VTFPQIMCFAMLGMLALVLAPYVPHVDETTRTLAMNVSNGGIALISASIALATQQAGATVKSSIVPPPAGGGKVP